MLKKLLNSNTLQRTDTWLPFLQLAKCQLVSVLFYPRTHEVNFWVPDRVSSAIEMGNSERNSKLGLTCFDQHFYSEKTFPGLSSFNKILEHCIGSKRPPEEMHASVRDSDINLPADPLGFSGSRRKRAPDKHKSQTTSQDADSCRSTTRLHFSPECGVSSVDFLTTVLGIPSGFNHSGTHVCMMRLNSRLQNSLQVSFFVSRALLVARSDSTSHSVMLSGCLSMAIPPPPRNVISGQLR